MTGFAEEQKNYKGYSIKAVIKSVNGKYLDCQVKGNEFSSPFEGEILSVVKKFVKRGRVTVWTDIFIDNPDFIDVAINLSTVSPVLKKLEEMQKSFSNFNYTVPLSTFLAGSNYVKTTCKPEIEKELKEKVILTIEKLLDNFNKMREKEGNTLKKDMLGRLKTIKKSLKSIEALRKNFFENQLNSYREKIKKIIENENIDEERITLEAGILADRLDISEEITRLNSHINLFENTMAETKASGKKLDFIIQEMFRETNTIGSKAKDKEIAFFVVNIKTELEKIREQVQNIE
jgi:uncharacterized protein (TIGR00255 family)